MFKNLNLEIGQRLSVCLNSKIPKASFVRIQPHETAFIDLPDPKTMFFYYLKNYLSKKNRFLYCSL